MIILAVNVKVSYLKKVNQYSHCVYYDGMGQYHAARSPPPRSAQSPRPPRPPAPPAHQQPPPRPRAPHDDDSHRSSSDRPASGCQRARQAAASIVRTTYYSQQPATSGMMRAGGGAILARAQSLTARPGAAMQAATMAEDGALSCLLLPGLICLAGGGA